jgi:hypothetical protein
MFVRLNCSFKTKSRSFFNPKNGRLFYLFLIEKNLNCLRIWKKCLVLLNFAVLCLDND